MSGGSREEGKSSAPGPPHRHRSASNRTSIETLSGLGDTCPNPAVWVRSPSLCPPGVLGVPVCFPMPTSPVGRNRYYRLPRAWHKAPSV